MDLGISRLTYKKTLINESIVGQPIKPTIKEFTTYKFFFKYLVLYIFIVGNR